MPQASALEPVDYVQRGFLLLCAAWMAYEIHTDGMFGLLRGIVIYTHEAGHILLIPFGEFLHIAGGTLAQLIFPLLFVGTFWLRGERYSAGITLFWLAMACSDASIYCQDAIDQNLPLLFSGMSASEELAAYGETEHDWVNMLQMLHLPISAAHPIALLLHLGAWLMWGLGLWIGLDACGVALPFTPDEGWRELQRRVRGRTRATGKQRRR